MFALHYTPVKTPAAENQVFGLQVAVLDWLKAWFRHGAQEKFHILIGDTAGQKEIEDTAAQAGIDSARLEMLDQRYARENLVRFDAIFRADPDPKQLLWQREQLSGSRFAFCGLSHAMAGMEGGAVLEPYVLAPSTETDAIVCPSRALAGAIRAFWNQYSDYLKARFGTVFRCPVQLPVIPLGVDMDAIAARATPEKRLAQRERLGLGDNDIMLLWVGRLSHAIKAHPLAMFQAAERAAELTGAAVHLVMQGYFMPAQAEPQFRKLAQDVCRKAKVSFIASNDTRFPDGLWAAGDIFLSLVDNMQESFGLTPIEAMAAGLPRVMSDWDGYRDSVQNGEDGFLVRTLAPPPGAGQALSELLVNGREVYSGFLARTALATAVDHEMAAQAIRRLIEDKDKRRSVAEQARMRARATYDWKRIIPAYETLWGELAARRRVNERAGLSCPLVPDPFTVYAGYPTGALKTSDRLSLGVPVDGMQMLLSHDINAFALDVMAPPEDVAKLISAVSSRDGILIAEIFAQFPAQDAAVLWRTIAWLIKLGIFRPA